MSMKDYRKALRLGMKSYHTQIAHGASPYLPVLEQTLQSSDIIARESLGVIDIPLDRVCGTCYSGREQTFAHNFLPIMDEDSEFASKWSALCAAHLSDGIHDPVAAFEYRNRYYITEGHKRVSVLRYFGAVTIRSSVVRLFSAPDDSQESRLYSAFLDFTRLSGINEVWLNQTADYSQLCSYVTGNLLRPWSEDEQKTFRIFYRAFSQAFSERISSSMTVGDALMLYLHIFDYQSVKTKTLPELRNDLTSLKKEMQKQASGQTAQVHLIPNEKKPLVTIPAKHPLRLALIHHSSAADSSWTFAHELGRSDLAAVKGIESFSIENADNDTKVEQAIVHAIDRKADLIFTTSPQMLSASIRTALKYPKAKILNCSLNTDHFSVRTYYARMYEISFLMGVIAGSLSTQNYIDYIADHEEYCLAADINAFALGVQLVNPHAKVVLKRSQESIYTASSAELCYVSDQSALHPSASFPKRVGLFRISKKGISNIALPFRRWGVIYEKIAKSYENGNWKNDSLQARSVSYWWGMDSGAVDLICTRGLPSGTKRLVDLLKDQLCRGSFSPFSDLLITQSGDEKDFRNAALSPQELLEMNWLVSNIICENMPGKDFLPQ